MRNDSVMVISFSRGIIAVAAAISVTLVLLALFALPAGAQETTLEESSVASKADETDSTPGAETPGTAAKTDSTGDEGQNTQSTKVTSEKQTFVQTGTQKANSQQSSRADGSLAGETDVRIAETNGNAIVNTVSVAVRSCEVADGATVRVRDADGTRVTLIDGQNVEIDANQDRVTIQGADSNGDINGFSQDPSGGNGNFGSPNDTVDGEVLSSTGITCGRDDNNGEGGNNGDATNNDNLNCDALLRRFRGASGGQYLDVNVSNQILICLAQEVNQDTAADGDLPDTGGPSLIGIAILGVVSALAGLSLVRGSRRED